jgi:hypothetical protein
VTRSPPELPNIEDATLRACLTPLMDAMNAGIPAAGPARVPASSNDNPSPSAGTTSFRDDDRSGTPDTLAEWRSLADDEAGAFRMIERFLAMTDAELESVAAAFPRQIGGTVDRIGRMKRRLAARYDTVTTALALLERAVARAQGSV